MTIAQDYDIKPGKSVEFTSTGQAGPSYFPTNLMNVLRVVVANVGVTNEVIVRGRIKNISTWTTLATITGSTTGTSVDISLVDEFSFNVNTYEASTGTPTLTFSGFVGDPGDVSVTVSGAVTVNNAAGASAVNIQDGGNSITVDAVSLPLPTGAATLSEQQTQTTSLQSIDDLVVAQGATVSSQKGAVALAATTNVTPSLPSDEMHPLSMDTLGQLRVQDPEAVLQLVGMSGTLLNIDTNMASTAATNANLTIMETAYKVNNAIFGRGVPAMGQLDDVATGSVTENNVSTVRITSGRGFHVNLRNAAGTSDLGDSINTNIGTITGTVGTVGASFTDILIQGGGTCNNSPTAGTHSNGRVAPLTLTESGTLWATLAASDGTPIDMVSLSSDIGAVAAATNTPNSAIARGVPIMGQLDDTGTATVTENNVGAARITSSRGIHVNERNAAGLEIPVAQGSTTSGQYGSLTMGAVTTAAPTYTTAQTSPLSISTSGRLRSQSTILDGSGLFGVDVTVLNAAGFGTAAVSLADPITLNTARVFSTGETAALCAATANSLATARYIQVESDGTVWTTNRGPTKQSYRAVSSSFASAATATDIATITGSGTKTVRITRIEIYGTQTTPGNVDVFIAKRSAANSGGTSASVTAVPLDSANAAATATCLQYTANPTPGALVGNIYGAKACVTSNAILGDPLLIDFGTRIAQQPVLRGTSQVLAVNLNGVTVTGGAWIVAWEWTEE